MASSNFPLGGMIYAPSKPNDCIIVTRTDTNTNTDGPDLNRIIRHISLQETWIVIDAAGHGTQIDNVSNASYASFLGTGSVFNTGDSLPLDFAQDARMAEIFAISSAMAELDIAESYVGLPITIERIIIRTASKFAIRKIPKIARANWEVSREDSFLTGLVKLVKIVHEFAMKFKNKGIAVCFWEVDASLLQEVKQLAIEAGLHPRKLDEDD